MDKAAKLAILPDEDTKHVDLWESESCVQGYLYPFGGCCVRIWH